MGWRWNGEWTEVEVSFLEGRFDKEKAFCIYAQVPKSE